MQGAEPMPGEAFNAMQQYYQGPPFPAFTVPGTPKSELFHPVRRLKYGARLADRHLTEKILLDSAAVPWYIVV